MTSMIDHQIRRREELRINPRSVATPAPTGGKGSRGNTGHLNLDRPLPTAPASKKMANYRARLALLQANRAKRKKVEAARRPISEYRRGLIVHRVRMVAYIRELAALARSASEIAALLNVSDVVVHKHMRRAGIKTQRRESKLRQAVRAGYEANQSPKQIAAQLHRNVATIKTTACKLGLTKGRVDPGRFRRGFEVPDDKRADYRHLTQRKGLTAHEAGEILGLVARPSDPRYTQSDQEAPRP